MNERIDRRVGTTGVGRPRDPNVDRSILVATRELLVETGYPKTTIAAIARRAGVGTSAIYRRWTCRESIIEDAVFGVQDASLPTATENLRDDLLTWTRWFVTRIAEPATRAAIPGLLSAYQHDDGTYARLVLHSEKPARTAFADRVAAAFPGSTDGDVAAAADSAFDLLVAATVVRGLTNGLLDAETFCTRTADSLALLLTAQLTGPGG